MSPLGWFLGLDLKYQLGIAVFMFTVGAYAVLFVLGRRWRREFEAQGVSYWRASKEERLEELISDVWEPRKITVLYGLSYFTNGFVRTAFNLWVPVFLLDEVGVGTIEAATAAARRARASAPPSPPCCRCGYWTWEATSWCSCLPVSPG